MENKINEAFRNIRAEEQLKQDTLKFIQKAADKKRRNYRKRTALAACASLFLIFFMGLLSYQLYFTESAYIDIDVNPSIELTVNRLDRVISVYAYNEDGKNILGTLDLKHKKYSDAVSAIISEMEQEGYLVNNGLISATLRTDWNEGTRLTYLEQTVTKYLSEHHNSSEHEIYAVDDDTKKQAEEENVSPAKYLAIAELQKIVPDVTVEGCKDHSISDIREEIHNHESQMHNQVKKRSQDKTHSQDKKRSQDKAHNQDKKRNQDKTHSQDKKRSQDKTHSQDKKRSQVKTHNQDKKNSQENKSGSENAHGDHAGMNKKSGHND